MQRSEVRLELLKLTHHIARDAKEAVDRAKVLEAYVFENEPGNEGTKKSPRKSAENPTPSK